MTEYDKLIEALNRDAPVDQYHMEDQDFDRMMWYRDNCRKAAVGMTELNEQNVELKKAVTEGISLINQNCFLAAILRMNEAMEKK